jgi:hypothetical protein
MNNNAMIVENIFLCGFDILQIYTATTIIDEHGTVPGR